MSQERESPEGADQVDSGTHKIKVEPSSRVSPKFTLNNRGLTGIDTTQKVPSSSRDQDQSSMPSFSSGRGRGYHHSSDSPYVAASMHDPRPSEEEAARIRQEMREMNRQRRGTNLNPSGQLMGREKQAVMTEFPTPERLVQERLDLATARAAQDEEDEAMAIEIQEKEYRADDAVDQALQAVTQEVPSYTPERRAITSGRTSVSEEDIDVNDDDNFDAHDDEDSETDEHSEEMLELGWLWKTEDYAPDGKPWIMKKSNGQQVRFPQRIPVDRLPAHVGEEDPSKLLIFLECEHEDHDSMGRFVKMEFRHEVDWHGKASVRRLNAWREQIFRRDLGGARSSRKFYIERERDAIVNLAKAMLGDQRITVPFKRLANKYNKAHNLKGVIHRTGEKLVSTPENAAKKKNKANPNDEKESCFLTKDRGAPWRTAAAITGQSKNWEEFRELLVEAKARNKPSRGRATKESDDEEESEPDSEPELMKDPSTPKTKVNTSGKKDTSTKRKRLDGAAEKTPLSRPRKIIKHEKATDEKADNVDKVDGFGGVGEDAEHDTNEG